MKILIAGATGYIGTRLIPKLFESGHEIVALARSRQRLHLPSSIKEHIEVIEGDLLDSPSLKKIPKEIDVAYYLVHSMKDSAKDFPHLEEESIRNFLSALKNTRVKQIIYLTGLISDPKLSKHLQSRLQVETIIKNQDIPFTVLRAGIIIGSGSASFEIIRDLVEKLPFMITPKWVDKLCQPIAIHDVLFYLEHITNHPQCLNRVFDIGGEEQMSYKQMLLRFAKFRHLKRWIVSIPVFTPRLSSYWLYFVTSTNYSLAISLVDSLKNDAICKDNAIKEIIPHECLGYEEALKRAFEKIEQHSVVSSWKDAFGLSKLKGDINQYMEVPKHGCVTLQFEGEFTQNRNKIIEKLWHIGGDSGWYTYDWAWKLRGEIDKLFGGVGLRRGRRDPAELFPGDALDFWRVLIADKEKGHLLLYAEMKLPGEAWLDFSLHPGRADEGGKLKVLATFRPRGLWGRFYWYLLFPIHILIFQKMAKVLVKP